MIFKPSNTIVAFWAVFTACTPPPEHGPVWHRIVTEKQAPRTGKIVNWNEEIIYFLLIDRFYNGDPSNDAGTNPASHVLYQPTRGNTQALKTYQGGDLQGIIDKLDYLENLGITTIWLSPVMNNSDQDFMGWWPYHGYSPVDLVTVDEHFGTMELLKQLIEAAHSRGLKVILDMVYNHVAPDHPWVVQKDYWQEKGYRLWFHPHSGIDGSTSIQNWQDQSQLENRELNGLPDLAQENPHVYDFLLDVSKYWILNTHCDGFRLDAVKHIPKSFWKRMNHDLHRFAGDDFLLLGEVFSGDPAYVAGYSQLGFNALFDIPMYYTINRVFAQGSSTKLLGEALARDRIFSAGTILSTLIDNHDVARFSYWARTDIKEKLKLAITFALSLNGCPMIYYGTETALEGAAPENEQSGQGQDYLNRLMMPWERISGTDADMVEFIKKLTHFRRTSKAMQQGQLLEVYKDYGIYAFFKWRPQQAVMVILNSSAFSEKRLVPLRGQLLPENGVLRDILTDSLLTYNADTLRLSLKPHGSRVLLYEGDKIAHVVHTNWQCDFTPALTRDLQMVSFAYSAPSTVKQVAVAGDFNGWSATENPMVYSKTGHWEASIPLKSARYRYKYVLDGTEWIADPDAREYELDPYGGKNSVMVVP
jgi:alpha-amylase